MGIQGRLVNNPDRVPTILQREDPVGRHPGPAHVLGEGDKRAMPKLSMVGMDEDRAGNRFYYEEGAPHTEEQAVLPDVWPRVARDPDPTGPPA
jgi:hypothetical protein